ncbi:SGNH/GDSL hydrolase family protein [Clostridium sp. WILCCON 0269]|uniref:SGNH/GDSL hydrolase family protein n=1 Tax=Candidatus Clostridium eludens TaxID=3381663 RepID=A0ABW8SQW4_9CLOT
MLKILKGIFLLTTTAAAIIAPATMSLAESKANAVQANTDVVVKSETGNGLQLEDIKNRKKITFQDAWVAWENNEKFPVAFFGDSTFDGNQTSGWVKNEIGQDHQPPNAFTTYLQNLIRKYTGSTTARIYNAGFSGQTADWAYSNINNIFSGAYSDVKMIGIGFGINDRLNKTSTKDYKEQFKENIENIILWCLKNNIQPFLLTTQATIEPGSIDSSTYPYRTSENINSIANTVKKELAQKYNIELIDINYYTSKLLANNETYSLKDIISTDHLHFTDAGHKFESEVLFAYFDPRVIILDGKKQIKLDFTSQNVKSNISSDRVLFEDDPINLWYTNYLFNNFVYYDKGDTSDVLLQDFIVLNLSNNLNLYSVQIQIPQNPGYTLPASDIQKPYVVFNDTRYILNDTFINNYFLSINMYKLFLVDKLAFGLNEIKLYSGQFNRVAAVGFYISQDFKNHSSKVSTFQNNDGTVTKQFLTPYKLQNYFEHKALFKLKLDTNINDSADLLVPIVDRINSGLLLDIKNNTIQLFSYVRNSQSLDDIVDLNQLLCSNTLSSSKNLMKSTGLYVEINAAGIKVYSDLKLSPILSYDTDGKVIGSGIFANFIKLLNQGNNEYAIVTADVLYNS